jgi:hypothetical protein
MQFMQSDILVSTVSWNQTASQNAWFQAWISIKWTRLKSVSNHWNGNLHTKLSWSHVKTQGLLLHLMTLIYIAVKEIKLTCTGCDPGRVNHVFNWSDILSVWAILWLEVTIHSLRPAKVIYISRGQSPQYIPKHLIL